MMHKQPDCINKCEKVYCCMEPAEVFREHSYEQRSEVTALRAQHHSQEICGKAGSCFKYTVNTCLHVCVNHLIVSCNHTRAQGKAYLNRMHTVHRKLLFCLCNETHDYQRNNSLSCGADDDPQRPSVSYKHVETFGV